MENAPDLIGRMDRCYKIAWSICLFSLWACTVQAQTISNAEYFFDTDPGIGNGTAIVISPADPITFTATINSTGLLAGYHFLFVRTQSSDGYWSLYEPKQFFIQQSITEAEYFFDTDPGLGLGTAIPITSFFDSGTFTSTVSTTGLLPGYHLLFVRTKDEANHWSLHDPEQFFIRQAITAAEYFFDTDPGLGLGTPIAVTPTLDQLSFTSSVSTSSLSPGEHFLFVRTRNEAGKWSMSEPQGFYIRVSIVTAEYFIDTDPGLGSGIPLAIPTPDDLVAINPTITIGALPNGPHFLFLRTRDVTGKWSLYEPQSFVVDDTLPIGLLTFDARATDDHQVKLTWTTATEINNDYFTAEHSKDGIHFTEVARVKGAGNSNIERQYTTIHQHPFQGMNYYQLKQTDNNGRLSYSKMVSVDMGKVPGLSIYPNPVFEDWFVDFSGVDDNEKLTIEVFDLTGRKCLEEKATGGTLLQLSRNTLASGIYLLYIKSGGGIFFVQKIAFY